MPYRCPDCGGKFTGLPRRDGGKKRCKGCRKKRRDKKALRLTDKPDAVTAFENLRQVVGDKWDDIDPDEYVREQRS